MPQKEHREYASSSSNVVRTLSSSRQLSPTGRGLTNDNNLDHLLDDLQTSMDRSRDHQYSLPNNTSTVVRERSVSPGGTKTNRVYKTAQYEYSTSSRSGKPQLRFNDTVTTTIAAEPDVQQKINSLDSLLLDLKTEREHSLDRDKIYSNVGIDEGLVEPNYAKTSNTYRQSGKSTSVNRELNFDSPSPSVVTTKTSTIRQSRSRQRSPVDVETHVTREVSYDSDPTVDNVPTINRSYNYASTKKLSSTERVASAPPHQVVPYNEYVDSIDSSAAVLNNDLDGLPLDGGLLPGPGTKVTTTIKTYTYEIPGNASVPTNQSFAYKTDTYNNNTITNNIYPAERDIPPPNKHPNVPGQTTYYKNETYNTLNRTDQIYPNEPPRRSVSPIHPPQPIVNKSVIYSRETRDTSSSNVYPQGPLPSDTAPPFPVYGQPGQPNQSTYIYKHETNTNTNVHRPGPIQANPPYDPNANAYPPHQPGPGPKQTYLYKREVTNTKNTVYGPPGGGQPQPIIEYPNDTYPPRNVTYNYSNNSTTRTIHHPDDRQPLIQPAPFPVDGSHPPNQVDGNPPKHLGDLLDTFGVQNGYSDSYNTVERRKEINTALTTGKAEPIVEPKPTMKPISGPPVYYPPGKQMFTKSEESQAGWRAGGGYANARGKYEYESESKSKSSSKTGGTMVPVCLPLCCAMPCSIM